MRIERAGRSRKASGGLRFIDRSRRPGKAGPGLFGVLEFGRLVDFCVRACASAPGVLVNRPGEVIAQFEQVAVRSLPIVLGAGLSVGMVTWLQTYRLLAAHGVESTLPSFLAVALFVELGPLLAGLLVAGRMGAGLAAELASMVQNEEIDARVALGTDPISSLVTPRAIACALAVPLLTVIIDASALLGSLAAELAAGKSTAALFWSKSLVYLRLTDVIPATLKTAVFGLLIGLAACWTGLVAGSSPEAVGRAATRGVVRATLVVFAANLVMVPLIQAAVSALEWTQ
jgi:phospholipid/cholesterol/gamma-HCH transport system permease protein